MSGTAPVPSRLLCSLCTTMSSRPTLIFAPTNPGFFALFTWLHVRLQSSYYTTWIKVTGTCKRENNYKSNLDRWRTVRTGTGWHQPVNSTAHSASIQPHVCVPIDSGQGMRAIGNVRVLPLQPPACRARCARRWARVPPSFLHVWSPDFFHHCWNV